MLLFQHRDDENRGTEQAQTAFGKSGNKIADLADIHSLIPVISVARVEPTVPEIPGLTEVDCSQMSDAVAEYSWCKHVSNASDAEDSQVDIHAS